MLQRYFKQLFQRFNTFCTWAVKLAHCPESIFKHSGRIRAIRWGVGEIFFELHQLQIFKSINTWKLLFVEILRLNSMLGCSARHSFQFSQSGMKIIRVKLQVCHHLAKLNCWGWKPNSWAPRDA